MDNCQKCTDSKADLLPRAVELAVSLYGPLSRDVIDQMRMAARRTRDSEEYQSDYKVPVDVIAIQVLSNYLVNIMVTGEASATL